MRMGWFKESHRHYLAAKGISTKKYMSLRNRDFPVKYLIASDNEMSAIARGYAPEVYEQVYGTGTVLDEHRIQVRREIERRSGEKAVDVVEEGIGSPVEMPSEVELVHLEREKGSDELKMVKEATLFDKDLIIPVGGEVKAPLTKQDETVHDVAVEEGVLVEKKEEPVQLLKVDFMDVVPSKHRMGELREGERRRAMVHGEHTYSSKKLPDKSSVGKHSSIHNGDSFNGYKVKVVSSKRLNDYAGMNSEAAKKLGFNGMDKGQVLVNKGVHGRDRERTVKHEIVEANLMRHGMPYWRAHMIASKKEREPLVR